MVPAEPNGGGGADRIDTILGLEGDATEGEALFDARCLACHDKAGLVDKAGPALAPLVPELADDELVDVMINGKPPMPAVSLEDQGAADVLAFLRASFGGA